MAHLHPIPDQRALFPVPQAAGLTPATPWFPSSFILCPHQTGLFLQVGSREGVFPSNQSPSHGEAGSSVCSLGSFPCRGPLDGHSVISTFLLIGPRGYI